MNFIDNNLTRGKLNLFDSDFVNSLIAGQDFLT